MKTEPALSYRITWITKSLSVGYAPMSYAQLDIVKSHGIDCIVNLCGEFADLHELEAAAGFEVYYLPIWDEDIPEMDAMESALSWMDEAIYLGKKVLVHCRHGIGRTGTFVTAYLLRKGLSPKAASKKLTNSSATPSNYSQWKLIKRYGKQSGTLTIRDPSLEGKTRVDLGPFFSDYDDLIKALDAEVAAHMENNTPRCGDKGHVCCRENFELPFMEVVYFHSKLNRDFQSAQRNDLIKNSVDVLKKERLLCPFYETSGCRIFVNRPIRCRVFGAADFSWNQTRISDLLFELSQFLFLAFSGRFLADTEFAFSMADTISGKFVQKYFHYLSGLENDSH